MSRRNGKATSKDLFIVQLKIADKVEVRSALVRVNYTTRRDNMKRGE